MVRARAPAVSYARRRDYHLRRDRFCTFIQLDISKTRGPFQRGRAGALYSLLPRRNCIEPARYSQRSSNCGIQISGRVHHSDPCDHRHHLDSRARDVEGAYRNSSLSHLCIIALPDPAVLRDRTEKLQLIQKKKPNILCWNGGPPLQIVCFSLVTLSSLLY